MSQGPYPPQGNFGQPQWGGPQGPQWGGPPGGPQQGWQGGPPPPAPKSGGGLLKILGIGCLGFIVIACIVGGILAVTLKQGLFGKVVASTNAQPNTAFVINYTQNNSEEHELWVDVDMSQNDGPLTGAVQVSANGQPVAQYTLNFQNGRGCFNPTGQGSSGCVNYSYAGTSISGRMYLFKIPSQSRGAAVAVTGTLAAPPGLVARRIQFQVRE
ncbi:MAG: hypothetical protein R3A52_21920 [Polyangiales bacterium]